jgi:hypothetical protein
MLKKIIMLFSLILGGIAQASCPAGSPSNYTISSRSDTDGSGRTITFTVCYPATMIVGTTYPIYVGMTRSGAAGTTGNAGLLSFLPPSGFTFGAPVQTVNPPATAFNTAPAFGGNNGTFAFAGGLSLTDAPVGFVPVTPTAPGVYTYQPINDFVGFFGLPNVTITVLASCPTVTGISATGCTVGNLNNFVTGGTSPYIFSQEGLPVGGTVIIDPSTGNYLFSDNSGSFQFAAQDVAGCTSSIGTITVDNPVIPTGSVLYNMVAGVPTTQSVGTTGGTPPYTYNLVGPAINGNVSFNALTDEFTFTQTTTGASRFRFFVTDANGCSSDTRSVYFYSCPAGRTVSAALGNNNAAFPLIYAICYPATVPVGLQFDITISLININPEGPVPSGPLRDFLPDPSQLAFAPGLSYAGNSGLPPEVVSFAPPPPTPSLLNQGGLGQIVYQFSIPSGAVVDVVAQIDAVVLGPQTYTATNVFNPGNELTPAVSILVVPGCDIVAGNTGITACTNNVEGSLVDLVTGGAGALAFTGPLSVSCTGSAVTISPTGNYSYVAPSGFAGPCNFVYQVTDSLDCTATGVVSIVATTVVANNGTLNICRDTAISDTLARFVSGTPLAPLSFAIVTNPLHGTITGFNAITGAFTYTPNALFVGVDSFQYQVTDANGCVSNVGTITIAIPCCPPTAPFPALVEQLYFNLPPLV